MSCRIELYGYESYNGDLVGAWCETHDFDLVEGVSPIVLDDVLALAAKHAEDVREVNS